MQSGGEGGGCCLLTCAGYSLLTGVPSGSFQAANHGLLVGQNGYGASQLGSYPYEAQRSEPKSL